MAEAVELDSAMDKVLVKAMIIGKTMARSPTAGAECRAAEKEGMLPLKARPAGPGYNAGIRKQSGVPVHSDWQAVGADRADEPLGGPS